MDVIAHCTSSFYSSAGEEKWEADRSDSELFESLMMVTRAISTAACQVVLTIFCRVLPNVMFSCCTCDECPEALRNDLIATAVAVYGKEPECLDRSFGNVTNLSDIGQALVMVVSCQIAIPKILKQSSLTFSSG
jgi:hypothetical protein